MKIEEIVLNDEFKKALDLMENTDQNLFITGKAGTGKSTLLQYFKDTTKKKIVVCAPTGLAALNVEGQTIHSLFKFPPKIIDSSDIKWGGNFPYRVIDTIVIDEVSMLRCDLFDGIDLFMRLNGRDKNAPFGGAQIILFGDLHQLPPIIDTDAKEYFEEIYKSPYFFDSNAMQDLNLEIINLTKVYRQKDNNYIDFLDRIRSGNIDSNVLELINSKVAVRSQDDDSIVLTPTNNIVRAINQQKLDRIPSKLHTYIAKVEGDFMKIGTSNIPVDIELKLKKGAKVMFVKNDSEKQWVNGTIGIVEELEENYVEVKLKNGNIVKVSTMVWQKIKYTYDKESRKIIPEVVGKLTQIPLKLAWAMTIHKSQGQTLGKIHLDISSGIWENGMLYVSLSRCRSFEDIKLESKIFSNDIKVDARVVEFLNNGLKK